MDFTLKIYSQFLETLQSQAYSFFTFQEYCEGKAKGKYVILRHDIDKKPYNALRIALLESKMGIRSTYFFLTLKEIFKPTVIKEIAGLGHEIGYHYRDFVDADGNSEKAIQSFQTNLFKLKSIVIINTIAMDGCPWSKYDNKDLWKTHNYKDFGIIGEPYFDIDFNHLHYLTDTGRMWDGERYSVRDKVTSRDDASNVSTVNYHNTNDLITAIQKGNFPLQLMITTHPQRWTDNKLEWMQELILQRIKNFVKIFLVKRFRRS
jgi:hypothetical protein